ncbi:MAG: insulinase family protein [Oscillospiraceae bacterium]|nr:insulinase family protein [Oscillospiraceae bacterium]
MRREYNKFLLPNGIRVVCEHVESIRSVVVGVWVAAGSRNEDAALSGISHFIEHMAFKGTHRRTARSIAEEIEFIGGHIDAFTAKDCTCFYTKTLDTHLGVAVDILSDIIMNPKLAGSDVDLERNVILEEINMYEDSPDELVHDLLVEGVWKGSPLGRPILGVPETIARIDSGALRGYMQAKYVPENIVISVAGCFEEAELLALLEKSFGGISAAGVREGGGLARARGAEVGTAHGAEAGAAHGGSQGRVEYRANTTLRQKDTEQIHLCAGFNGIELGDDDIYALHLANYIFGGGMSSVLFQKIREELGLVYSIYSFISAYRGAGLFIVYAGMQPGRAGVVFNMILDELKAFTQAGMTGELLERSKDQFKGSFIMGLESPNARMSSLGKSELLLGYINPPEKIVAKVEAVTLDKVYEVMGRVFDIGGLAVSAVGRIDGDLENILRRAV